MIEEIEELRWLGRPFTKRTALEFENLKEQMMELAYSGDAEYEKIVLEKLASGMKKILKECGCEISSDWCPHTEESPERSVSPRKASVESNEW